MLACPLNVIEHIKRSFFHMPILQQTTSRFCPWRRKCKDFFFKNRFPCLNMYVYKMALCFPQYILHNWALHTYTLILCYLSLSISFFIHSFVLKIVSGRREMQKRSIKEAPILNSSCKLFKNKSVDKAAGVFFSFEGEGKKSLFYLKCIAIYS